MKLARLALVLILSLVLLCSVCPIVQADDPAGGASVELKVKIVRRPAGGGGGGGGADRSPPRISDIALCPAGVTKTTADICWKTHEKSDSQVEYWTSPSMFSGLDEEMVYSHHIHLTSLVPATTYHYKTMSQDRSGNLAVSDEYTFTTLGTPATFSVSALEITPTVVDIGDKVTFSVLAVNSGDAPGSYKVRFKIDEAVVATKEVTVAGGASEKVICTTSKDAAGTYAVSVDGLSGSFTVKKAVPPPPPVVPLPPVAPPAPAVNWFVVGGIIAAVVAAAVITFFLWVRRRTAD